MRRRTSATDRSVPPSRQVFTDCLRTCADCDLQHPRRRNATAVAVWSGSENTRGVRSESDSADTERDAADRSASPDALPTASHPKCDPAPTAPDLCAGHSHYTDTGGGRAARSECARDSSRHRRCRLLARPRNQAAPKSAFNRAVIPRVLLGCEHNKRERHRVGSGAKWDRPLSSGPPSRPPKPLAVRAGGRILPRVN